MSAQALVSIVIRSQNQGHHLGDAVASVWRSLHRSVEVIVVDDGSTDDTAIVARSFAGVRYIRLERAGLAASWNRGLEESRGQYVVFMEAVDTLAPAAIDVGISELTAHPVCAFVFGRCRTLAPDGRPEAAAAAPTRIDRDVYRELLRGNWIGSAAAVMFKRDAVVRTGGFDSSANGSAIYGLCLQIARANPAHDHGQLVAYRRHDSSGADDSGRLLREGLVALRRERDFVVDDTSLLAAYDEGWRAWQSRYGSELLLEIQDHIRARRWVAAAARTFVLGWFCPGHLLREVRRLTAHARPEESR